MRQQRWRRGGAMHSWRVRFSQGQHEPKLSSTSCRCTVNLSRLSRGGSVRSSERGMLRASGPVLSQFGVSEFSTYMSTYTCTCNPRTAVGPKAETDLTKITGAGPEGVCSLLQACRSCRVRPGGHRHVAPGSGSRSPATTRAGTRRSHTRGRGIGDCGFEFRR
jgi:hypothetical protein